MTVSVIICTRNRHNDLLDCLTCLKNQSQQPTELILIENTNENKFFSLQSLKTFFQGTSIRCKYLSTKAQTLSASRNLGIIHASSSLLLFIDDDVVFDRDLVKKYRSLHKKYPKPLGFVGKVLPYHRDAFSKFGSWYSTGKLLQQKRMCEVDHYAGSTFSLVRRTVLKHKVLYKEDWQTGEDLDFLLRLGKKKAKLYFYPGLSTRHKYKHTIWQFCKKHFQYAKFFVLQSQTYPEYFSVDKYFPTKKKQWLFLPFFWLKKSYVFSKYLVLDGEMDAELFWPSFFAHISEFAGIYSSPQGRQLLLNNFRSTWFSPQEKQA